MWYILKWLFTVLVRNNCLGKEENSTKSTSEAFVLQQPTIFYNLHDWLPKMKIFFFSDIIDALVYSQYSVRRSRWSQTEVLLTNLVRGELIPLDQIQKFHPGYPDLLVYCVVAWDSWKTVT